MAPRKNFNNIIVSEEFRVQSESILKQFTQDDNLLKYEFPSSLTNVERAWLHNYVKTFGLSSKSHGKEPTRTLTIYKPKDKANKDKVTLSISKDSVFMIKEFLNKYPLSREKADVNSLRKRNRHTDCTDTNMGQLTFGVPQLPGFGHDSELLKFRQGLPIWPMREYLMEAIVSNQVLIVCGATGSGKTTQIPQFILDYGASCNEKCRIICTQPRRISAVAVAERVATERGEKSGQTVGFHIRLESCVGPKTVLIYCTNGILLRTLMNGDACLKSFTHIIVDEIHERDRFSDFLLICLRECLVHYPHLRLILMSATIDVNTFKNYFNNAPVINIPGRTFPVDEYYLEDILLKTKYESPAMQNLKKKHKIVAPQVVNEVVPQPEIVNYNDLSFDLQLEMQECITECVTDGSEDSFAQLLQLILSDHVPVNFQHPDNGYTGLMASAMHGNVNICTQLLNFGADMKLRSRENCSAFDYAFMKEQFEVAELLKQYEEYYESHPGSATQHKNQSGASDDEKQQLLDIYHRTASDQVIDFDLLHATLIHIHLNTDHGSILVFLTGYDDIVTVKDRILNDKDFRRETYEVFTLHGLMQISDQHRVFGRLEHKRKIILSTNIAETSITIDDVVFVIDSGKVKEKCYDALTGICSLQSAWISRACSKQRAGRAGRTQPGICYHLFSKYRSDSLQPYPTPEMVRMPLHELCLQTKMLAPKDTRIADFLSRALEPPSSIAVGNAIKHLQEIGALDEREDLTLLGQHLVDLPVEPRLGKMLIYAVIFKCIDPLLTIVAFLSYRDPFVLPSINYQKNVALNMRKQFADSTFSDHMILLRAFQNWQEARLSKSERYFCNKFFVSSATMEMTVHIRSQLLAQLRAAGFVKTRPPGDIRDLNEHANNWPLIKAILAAGFYPNIAYVNKNSMQIRTKKEKKIYINSSSSLRDASSSDHAQCVRKIPTNLLVFEELSRTGNNYNIRSVTSISPLTIALFASNDMVIDTGSDDSDSEDEFIGSRVIINNWLVFEGASDILNMIAALREKMNFMLTKKIANPYKLSSVHDEALLSVVCRVISKEDSCTGLVQPIGIGQRPKIMTSSNYPSDYNGSKHARKIGPAKRTAETSSAALHFKPVSGCHYNKYVPQTSNNRSSEAVQNIVCPFPENIGYFVPYNCPQPAYPQSDLSAVTQNMNMMTLQNNVPYYNPFGYNYNSLYSQQVNYNSNVQEQSDFKNNGVTVDMEGACALDPNPTIIQETPSVDFSQCEVPWALQYRIPESTSFFIIKTGSIKSIDVSISKKTWIFSPQTERKLLRVLQTGRHVMLIFTVTGSNCFQGIARLLCGPSTEFSHYNINCPIEWLSRADITYEQVKAFGLPCLTDGDELDANIGVELWMMFMNCSPRIPLQLEPLGIPPGRAITKTRKQ